MDVLAIFLNSLIEKYLVESGYFPKSTTTARRKIRHVEAITLVFTGHFVRVERKLHRLEHGSRHVRLPRYKFASHAEDTKVD